MMMVMFVPHEIPVDFTLNVWDVGATIAGSAIAVGLAVLAICATRRGDARARRRNLADRLSAMVPRRISYQRNPSAGIASEFHGEWSAVEILIANETNGASAFPRSFERDLAEERRDLLVYGGQRRYEVARATKIANDETHGLPGEPDDTRA